MKKITFTIVGLLTAIMSYAQTYSTGVIDLSTEAGLEYSVELDVTSTMVTMTLVGPSDRWLGIGFDTTNMYAGKDVLIFDGTTLSDRHYGYPGQPDGELSQGIVPTIDDREDWTTVSNTVVSGVRTIVATRVRDTGNVHDHVFSASANTINIAWARGDGNFTLQYHGTTNRGVTMQDFTLNTKTFNISEFNISPNPSSSKLAISLPSVIDHLRLEVFDVLGKKVYENVLNGMQTVVNVSQWNNGIYLVRVSTDKQTQTKRFVKQ